ncbi:MAG: VOC family protein [Actinomycetes bacterium]
MDLSELFHVGIVVPDLDAAKAHFTELLGLDWGPVVESLIGIAGPDGVRHEVVNRICYSTAPPYLELIQETPGTTWVCNEFSNLHHLGFFSSDPGAVSTHLGERRCPLEVVDAQVGDAPPNWVYHRDPLGVRVEIVDGGLRDMMATYLWQPPPA